ncbi:hypothetical protein [Pseudonocardia sp. ICBG1142]|uniref:hypothetical protein n=1 Tax=Pseudonocardia sp. ICBG1142 TaxID=2846760 RepID=UPI001CF6801B|nr:hypothetical protein [Pseudonocardia sp. ICBG1142]
MPNDEMPPGSAFGVTGSQGGIDVVLYEARTTSSHQQLIILHEFAHMLLRHPPSEVLHTQAEVETFREIDAGAVAEALGVALPDAALISPPPSAQQQRRRRWWRPGRRPHHPTDGSSAITGGNLYARVCEQEAEMLATILLGWVPGQAGYIPARPRSSLDEYLGDQGAW